MADDQFSADVTPSSASAPAGPKPGRLAPPPPGMNPNEALNLLSDLESRLGQLKSWQAESDRHAADVAEQAELIARQEAELDVRRQAFAAEHASLEADRAETQRTREQLETQRQELEANRQELETQRQALATSEEQAIEREMELEEHWQSFRQQKSDLEARMQACENRVLTLDERQHALDGRDSDLAQQQTELDAQRQALEQSQQELEAGRAELADHRQQVEALEADLAAQRQDIAATRATVDEDQAALTSERTEFAEQRQALKDRKNELSKAYLELKLRQENLEAQQASLDRARSELTEQAGQQSSHDTLMPGFVPDFDALDHPRPQARRSGGDEAARAELEARGRELDAQQAELHRKHNAFRQKLEQSKQKIVEQRQAVLDHEARVLAQAEELAARREALDAEQVALNARQQEIDAKAADLDRLKHDFDSTTDSAETVMGLSVGKQASANPPLDARAAELAQREEAFRTRKHELRESLEADKRELAAEREALAQQQSDLDELAGALEMRSTELDHLASELEARDRALVARAAELETRDAGDPVAAYNHEHLSEDDDLDLLERTAALDRREAELNQRAADLAEQEADLLARIDQAPAAAVSFVPASGDHAELAAELARVTGELEAMRDKHEKRKAQMIQADAVIQKRRDKVRQYLTLLREQTEKLRAAESRVESNGAQFAGLEKERRNLVEVKRFLETSEKAMVQKWATKTAATVAALIILAILSAVTFSWFAGKQLAQPQWQATMALSLTAGEAIASTADSSEAPQPGIDGSSPEPGDVLVAEEELQPDWLTIFAQRIVSEPVLNGTLDRLDQQGLRRFGSAASLRNELASRLTVSGSPSRVELAYITTDGNDAELVLDAVGKATMAHQMTLDREAGRGDRVRIVQTAERLSEPVQDDTYRFMAYCLGGIAGLGLLIGLGLRLVLARSRRIMEEADGVPALATLDKPGTWSPVPSAESQNP